MGMFDRMGRVISSNFNALLDKAEDPKKSVEQTLSEMREQICAARREVVASVAAEKQLRNKIAELDQEVEKWQKRAELAVRHDDDDLARQALTHKNRLTAERDRAEGLRAEQRGHALEMKAELERMEQKLEELVARKGRLIASAKQVKAGSSSVETFGAGPQGGAFQEFRRMEDQIEGIESALSAQREIEQALGGSAIGAGMTGAELEAKFRALEGSARTELLDLASPKSDVDDELKSLKKKIRIGP